MALKRVKEFGDPAGFYVNKKKSKIMCKNLSTTIIAKLAKISECNIVQKAKYLGIELTMKNIDLIYNDYGKLWV